MHAAGISNEDLSLLDAVPRTAVAYTPINGMLIVKAAASRVPLDYLVAHCDVGVLALEPGVCVDGVRRTDGDMPVVKTSLLLGPDPRGNEGRLSEGRRSNCVAKERPGRIQCEYADEVLWRED